MTPWSLLALAQAAQQGAEPAIPPFDRWLVNVATIVGIVAPVVVAGWRLAKRQSKTEDMVVAMNDPKSPSHVALASEVDGVGERVNRHENELGRLDEKVAALRDVVTSGQRDTLEAIRAIGSQMSAATHEVQLEVRELRTTANLADALMKATERLGETLVRAIRDGGNPPEQRGKD